MRKDFLRRVRRAIADPNLQRAYEFNASVTRSAWNHGTATLSDFEDKRLRAHEIRRQTVDDIHSYLELFIQRVSRNGWRVFRAQDDAEACRLVVNIARDHGAKLVAKSKSMVTEEIRLNQALEAVGIRSVETDMGEFIVQLRGETPAHITGPALYLSREQVAETFTRELGIPYNSNIEALNSTARIVLRRIFLEADIGISGVNFGVVESGTVCLVTNEGNGRMVITAPPVHIALMGVERLVPTFEDLDLMLQLLPRTASGQKLTSYVSLIQGPRRPGEPDGPDERYLILVDNGRLSMAEGPISEALMCIRCGACLDACPVYREIGGHSYASVYPGPIGSIISPGLFGLAAYGHLAKASTLCGACREACPVLIDHPALLLRLRHQYTQQVSQPVFLRLGMRLYAWLMDDPRRCRWAQRLGARVSRLLPRKDRWLFVLPPPLSAWTRSRHFPPLATLPFRARWREARELEAPQVAFSKSVTQPDTRAMHEPEQNNTVKFATELEALGGEFIRCTSEQAPALIISRLRAMNIKRLLTWGVTHLPLTSILRYLKEEGFELVEPDIYPCDPAERLETYAEFGQFDAGLTGSLAALANTGTLVLTTGPDQSGITSLLPPIHIALMRAEDIYTDMTKWLATGGKRVVTDASITTLISGPSRSADIEMSLTIGAHGPGTLIVYCID